MAFGLSLFELLGLGANISQFVDLGLTVKDATNMQILKALELQDNNYLKTIIENQNKIIKLLEDIKK